jgi:hypothetical protein
MIFGVHGDGKGAVVDDVVSSIKNRASAFQVGAKLVK